MNTITLKSIKISRSMSEETLAYTANVFLNNKKIGYASNDGNGGSTHVRLSESFNREIGIAICEANNIERFGDLECPLNNGLEEIVDHLAYAKDLTTDLKKLTTKVAWQNEGHAEGEYAQVNLKMKDARAPQYMEKVKTETGFRRFLNAMSLEELAAEFAYGQSVATKLSA